MYVKDSIVKSALILLLALCIGSTSVFSMGTPGQSANKLDKFSSITTLLGLSCDDSGIQCTAVGYVQNPTSAFPLSYSTSNGGASWNAPIQLSPLSASTPSFLLDVHCSSNGLQCIALGASIALETTTPLNYISQDGGGTWSAPQAMSTPENTNFNVLINISCDASNQNCIAVGYSNPPGNEVPLVYTSSDGGTNWNYAQLTLPANASTGVLLGISCNSTIVQCTAIGYGNLANAIIPISYSSSDGGSTWGTPTLATLPDGAESTVLTQISCDSNTGLQCLALGAATLSGKTIPLNYISPDGGATWSLAILPTPPTNSLLSGFSALSCDSQTTNCLAMGYTLNDSILIPLSYSTTDGGASWSAATQLSPPYSENNSFTVLVQLACDLLMQNCLTIGDYINATSVIPLSYTSSEGGASWGVSSLLQVP